MSGEHRARIVKRRLHGPRVLVARSLQHARNSAEIDWGWRRVSSGWLDDEGVVVTYAKHAETMRGLDYGSRTVVYLGYEYWAHDDWDKIGDVVAARQYRVVTPREKRKG